MKAKEFPCPEYAKCAGTHVLELPLATTKRDEDAVNKRFGIIGHIHNVAVKHMKQCLEALRSDEEYKALKEQYAALKAVCSDEVFASEAKPVTDRINELQAAYGLTETSLHEYIKVQARMFKKNLSSQQVQKEASRVWKGVEKVLYGDGRDIRFKPYREITTICGKSPRNGVKFFSRYHNYLNKNDDVLYADGQIVWNGLIIRVKIDYKDPYVCESLQHNVKYCEIKRMMFPSGWRYYVSLYLDGPAPKKLTAGDAPLCEIDPGVSTMAVYSEEKVILRELAPEAKSYQKKIQRLRSQIDDCKRRMNPENYNADGTVKRGRHKWKLSKAAQRKQRMVTVLCRKEAANRKDSHCRLVNDILRISPHIRLEPMDYKALQKKAKKTERQDKPSEVTASSGERRTVYKYKRKKRFGTSCRTRAPSMFISILTEKALRYGGSVAYIDTRSIKPSQYDHVSKDFVKTDLKTRSKIVGGHVVQRDLYSAFLGYCTASDGRTFDHDKADALFERFVITQDEELSLMKAQGISMPQCFGF